MLSFIRRYRTWFLVLFFFCGIALVISFGLPGMKGGSFGGGAQSAVAGRVGDKIVSANELVQQINSRREQAQQFFSAQFQDGANKDLINQLINAQAAPDRVLDSLIQEKFLIYMSEEMGLKASPLAIRYAIEQEPYFQKNGVFDPLIYRERVTQPGDFEHNIANQILRNSAARVVALGMGLESEYESKLDESLDKKYYFESLRIMPQSFMSEVKADKAAVEAFLAKEDSKIDLEDYYNRHLNEYKKEEEVNASHILVRDNEGGEEKIKEVALEIKEGKITFEEAAKKYSSDKANAEKGGALGFFSRGRMDPAFEKTAFDLKEKGQVSEPVKSSFGWHLVKLNDRHAAEEKPLEDVKLDIAPEVLKEKLAKEKAQEFAEKLAQGAKDASAAEKTKLNLEWQSLGVWTPLSEQLAGFASDQVSTADLVTLSESNRYLGKVIRQGNSFNVIRWTTPPADAENTPSPMNSGIVAKSQESFEFFFQNGMKSLEKKDKIYRSQEILSQLNQQLQQTR